MKEKKNNKKSSMGFGCILIRIAAVLFCLVVVSTYLMSGLFARYTAGNKGTDSARVAGFHVEVDQPDGIEIEYTVSQNDEGAYDIVVKNYSEVAVTYHVDVEVHKADADFDIVVALNEEELDTSKTTKKRFENVGYLPPDDASDDTVPKSTCSLVFSVLNWGDFTKSASNTFKTQQLSFDVVVEVVQVD